MALQFKTKRGRCTIFFCVLLTIIAIILMIIALELDSWIVGEDKENTGRRQTQGILESCFRSAGGRERCAKWRPLDLQNPPWLAMYILWVIGMIFSALSNLQLFLAACKIGMKDNFIIGRNVFLLSFFIIAVGMVIIPVGYKFLGEECRTDDARGCGLDCSSGEDRDFNYFELCQPWYPGQAFLIGVIGAAILMVSAVAANCVQLQSMPDEDDDFFDPNESTA